VEEFENSKLKFNYEGDPEKNTGLLLERFFAPISVDRPDYSPGIDPYREITVRDIIYVELHSYSKSIDIYDEIGKVKNVDREFWNLKDAGNSIMEKPELVQLDTIVNNDFKYNKNLSIMNEKNLDYLKNTLKYMGFEDRVNEQLERDIRAGKEESRPVDSKQFNNLQTDSTLHFSKGKENDMYFFNKYDVTVTREDGRSESQTMYINQVKVYNEEKLREETRLSGFTLKEAANLLDGRAVYREFTNKDGEQYKAWKQIDFTQQDDRKNYKYHTFHENYGFNLEKAMDKRNILEANSTEGKDALIKSWQKGNLQAVTIEENGSKERRYLAADPKNRDFIEYDNNFKLIQKEAQEVNLKFKRTDQNVDDKDLKKGGAEKNVSAGIGQENDDSKKKLNKGGKGKNGKEGKDESLLPKNRTAKSKGQGV
jgi:hypothetical protein